MNKDYTSPRKLSAAFLAIGEVTLPKWAIGLIKAADLNMSSNWCLENAARAISVPFKPITSPSQLQIYTLSHVNKDAKKWKVTFKKNLFSQFGSWKLSLYALLTVINVFVLLSNNRFYNVLKVKVKFWLRIEVFQKLKGNKHKLEKGKLKQGKN